MRAYPGFHGAIPLVLLFVLQNTLIGLRCGGLRIMLLNCPSSAIFGVTAGGREGHFGRIMLALSCFARLLLR
jgi:hypothetical protein